MGLVRKCLLGDAKEEADAKAKELREIEAVAKKEYEEHSEEWKDFFGIDKSVINSEERKTADAVAVADAPRLSVV